MSKEQIGRELAAIFGAGGYQPPRIVSHSAEHLRKMTIDVNACNSAFGAKSADEGQEGGDEGGKDEAVAY